MRGNKYNYLLSVFCLAALTSTSARELPAFVRNTQDAESVITVDRYLDFLAPIYTEAKNTPLPDKKESYLLLSTSAYEQALSRLGYLEERQSIERFFVSVFVGTDSRDLRMAAMRFFQIVGIITPENTVTLNHFMASPRDLDDDQLTALHQTFILADNESRLNIPDELKLQIYGAYSRQIEAGLRSRIGNYVAFIEIGTELLASSELTLEDKRDVQNRLSQMISQGLVAGKMSFNEILSLATSFTSSLGRNGLARGRSAHDGFSLLLLIDQALLDGADLDFMQRRAASLSLINYIYQVQRHSQDDFELLCQKVEELLVSVKGDYVLESHYINVMSFSAQVEGYVYNRALSLWDNSEVSDETRYMLLWYFRETGNSDLLPRHLRKLNELWALKKNAPDHFLEGESYYKLAMAITANIFVLGDLKGDLTSMDLNDRVVYILDQDL